MSRQIPKATIPEHKKLMNVKRIRIMKIEASLSHSRYEEMITAKRSLFPVKNRIAKARNAMSGTKVINRYTVLRMVIN